MDTFFVEQCIEKTPYSQQLDDLSIVKLLIFVGDKTFSKYKFKNAYHHYPVNRKYGNENSKLVTKIVLSTAYNRKTASD